MIMHYRSLLGAALIAISLGAIAPLWAHQKIDSNSTRNQTANLKQIDYTLVVQQGQTFAQLIRQAELQATNLVEQEFAADPNIAEISINIVGDRAGQQAPLLQARVSRASWQQQPTIRQWTKYFATSAVLLGFNNPERTPSAAPENPTTPRQQPINSPPPPSNSRVQPSTPPAPSTPSQSNSPALPNTSQPGGGASLEESDPGYR